MHTINRLLLAALLCSSFSLRAQLPNTLTPTEKIYGLSRFWEEVNYNFIYLEKTGKARWDSLYKEYIPLVLATKNDYEYFRELEKFCAFLKDGHTNVYLPQKKEYERMNTMFGDYRLFMQNINGKAIVVRTNLSKKTEIPVGSEIIEVNGLPIEKYLEKFVMPYIASSTDYVLKDWAIARMFQGFPGDAFDVKIKKPKGDVISLKLTHAQTNEKEVFPEFDQNGQLLDFKWVKPGIAYVALNSFSDPKIDSLFIAKLPELYKAKGLIIDLRYNGGGSTTIGALILQYLTNDKVLYGSKSITRHHIASFKAWGIDMTAKDTLEDKSGWAGKCYLCNNDKLYYEFEYSGDSIQLNAPRIVIPTAILIGHNTASAAEDFLILADNQKHMTKIGENTFGSTGQPYSFDLVGGASARICTKKDIYPDGREFVGYGIKPNIEVKMTVDDYLQKKDPALTKAIEHVSSKIK